MLLAVVIVSNSLGNVALGYGMRGAPNYSSYSPLDLVRSGVANLADPWVMVAVCLLAVFFAAHSLVLSWTDLSYVLLVTSIGYVLTALLSATLLGETVTPGRWAGTILVTCGVGVVGSTPSSTVEERP